MRAVVHSPDTGSNQFFNLAADLIAAARSGDEYVSPYVTPADEEAITNIGFATPGASFSMTCRNREADGVVSAAALAVMFDFEKFPSGHQDMLVLVTDETGSLLGSLTSDQDWPVEWGTEGCAVVTVPMDVALTPGQTVTATFLVGPNYERTMASVDVPV